MEAQWHIQCDGFYGYFSNVGTQCRELLDALATIGSPVLQEMFYGAFGRFPDGQPSADDDEFDAQLSSITEAESDAFDQHDSEFYGMDDQIPPILWAYWQKHHPNIH